MADKQHYVKVTFEFGTDEDGVFTPKNSGECVWVSMPYEAAVILQNSSVLPAITDMISSAGKLGMDVVTTGSVPPGQAKR